MMMSGNERASKRERGGVCGCVEGKCDFMNVSCKHINQT
jgi:hypothetical protein